MNFFGVTSCRQQGASHEGVESVAEVVGEHY